MQTVLTVEGVVHCKSLSPQALDDKRGNLAVVFYQKYSHKIHPNVLQIAWGVGHGVT
jgi:hypothetical protein